MYHSRYCIRDFRLHTINAINPPVHKQSFHRVRAKVVSESTSTFVVVFVVPITRQTQISFVCAQMSFAHPHRNLIHLFQDGIP